MLLEGVAYVARQGSRNGKIGDFAIEVAMQPGGFGAPLITGRFADTEERQLLFFEAPVGARYLRLVALSPLDVGLPFAAVAELQPIRSVPGRSAKEELASNARAVEAPAGPLADEVKAFARATWESVTLPHTAILEPRTGNTRQWQGMCMYRRQLSIPTELSGRQLILEFEAAMQVADVWLGDKHLARHSGGYTPLHIDITASATPGQPQVLTVLLDNRDAPEVPPGKPVDTLDFNYWSGLYRDVHLTAKAPLHVTDPALSGTVAGGGVRVSFRDVSRTAAKVEVVTEVANTGGTSAEFHIRQELLSPGGEIVATYLGPTLALAPGAKASASATLEVTAPKLWSPASPSLYRLITRVLEGSLEVDRVQTRIGIRWFELSRERGFVLNDEPLALTGTNRHQEFPWIGNAAPDNLSLRDMKKIKAAGFNLVRLGHYPQDPSVLAACDELGLLVIDPIPGWQHFSASPRFIERTERDIRDMIRRDRNHPSVLLFEVILNESSPPTEWKDMAVRTAHEELPGPQCFTSGDRYGYDGWDVPYNDWTGDNTRPNNSTKPSLIREYGDYEFGGGNSTTRRTRAASEAEQLIATWNVVWSHNRNRSQLPWTIGDANWVMFDHNRGCAPSLSSCGNSDIVRLPKFAYGFFQSQRDPQTAGAVVHLATFWTPRESPSQVVVFSNCDEVELRLNGRRIARQTPDQGPDTPYRPDHNWGEGPAHPFDGGNAQHLTHPPFTFTGLDFEPGELHAIGDLAGAVVAEDRVATPGEPAALELQADLEGVPLATNDAVFIHARILDAAGEPVPIDNHTVVAIELAGPARLVSPSEVTAVGGVASFMLRTSGEHGSIKLHVTADGLDAGALVLKSHDR